MKRHRVESGTKVDLSDYDPRDQSGFDDGKKEGREQVDELNARLEELQELMWAQRKEKLLVVLQAPDCGGKDGVIRHVFDGVNPLGVRVAQFGRPTDEELSHDYLWRVHRHTPGKGQIVLFNRSHYEDVLVVRVHNLVPEEVWSRRYDHINAFEQLLADEGTTILKFFLHISRDEQKQRLQERLDRPDKQWKFSAADLKERARWDDYQTAFSEVLSRTSTEHAPWYIVPSDRKWYRNLAISQILVDTLEGMKMSYPPAADGLADVVID